MKLVFATGNVGKLREASEILGEGFELVSLAQVGIEEDIPETGETLVDNSLQKALYLYDRIGCDCFADDTGLEVDALGGAPGVHSARYATDGHDFAANNRLLLKNLEGETNRSAHFRTVIALILDGKEYLFEGRVEGAIATEESGSEGFGYDPLFVPSGEIITFAQMSAEAKNAISHRGRAVAKLVKFLKNGEL